MTRVVIDTNVIVSSILSQAPDSPPRIIRRKWFVKELEVVLSAQLIDEITAVLNRPHLLEYSSSVRAEVRIFLEGLAQFNVVVAPSHKPAFPISRDPKDDFLLHLASECHVDAIISGDRDLLILKRHEGIPILSPADFLVWEQGRIQ